MAEKWTITVTLTLKQVLFFFQMKYFVLPLDCWLYRDCNWLYTNCPHDWENGICRTPFQVISFSSLSVSSHTFVD